LDSANHNLDNYRSPWMDEELDMLRDSIDRFVESEMLPHDLRWREQKYVDRAIWHRAGELGFLLMDIPEEYGGMGGDFRHEALLYEAVCGRGITSFGQGVHSITANYLRNHGSEAQKHRWLPKLASGELVGAIAMSEPAAGSDLRGIRTRAVRDGDHYILNGSKIFITNGYHAGLIAVVAKTGTGQDSQSISILMVETKDLPGFKVGRILDKIGQPGQDTTELFFEDARVPVDCLLGDGEGQGLHQLMADLPYERLLVAICGVAIMERALEITIDYTRHRKAFGAAVLSFQNTRFELAEIKTITRVARTFVDRCIEQIVRGELDTTTASMAKYWVTEMQCQMLDRCLQLHGGYGFMKEYEIARLYTDSRVQRIYAGTNEIMKEIIGRSL